jgi:hypothetical protein
MPSSQETPRAEMEVRTSTRACCEMPKRVFRYSSVRTPSSWFYRFVSIRQKKLTEGQATDVPRCELLTETRAFTFRWFCRACAEKVVRVGDNEASLIKQVRVRVRMGC